MTDAEMTMLVKRAYQTILDMGIKNTNITIEIRRGEPRSIRFDVEVKPEYPENEV